MAFPFTPSRALRRLVAALLAGCVILSSPGLAHITCPDSATSFGDRVAAAAGHGVAGSHAMHAGHGARTDGGSADHRDHGSGGEPAQCDDGGCSSAPGSAGCAMMMQCTAAVLVAANAQPTAAASVAVQPSARTSGRLIELASPPDSPPPRA